ncbi:hypothetical protein R5W23_002010 [Gemmata sp. JC673]|uniref:Uncharacterized protein n=1 Tax=Gemmata algarum TaxID=2975278 RepID=A0ABU5F0P1_9BACT|nr:hypothetical protein [Gemmata algarum]MDY3560764.1 hypothetical protein [Gemmata algarum]
MSVLVALTAVLIGLAPGDRPHVLVVVGAAGTPEYGAAFQKWADRWQTAAQKGSSEFVCIGQEPEGKESDRDKLQALLARLPRASAAPLWVVLIGHGTDDGREARFNLRGPDVTARELADWLGPVKRPVAVVNCTSASGSFVTHLSGPDRVVVTATRSGSESNYARFGEHIANAIGDPTADLDKDGQVSLLEAFLTASDRVREFYRSEGRLATEHALLDDNGDKLGSAADWFQGVRAVKRAKDGAPVDGTRAHQWHLIPSARERALPAEVRKRRDELELALAGLRDQKSRIGEDEYYARVEKLMVELARLYATASPAPVPKP